MFNIRKLSLFILAVACHSVEALTQKNSHQPVEFTILITSYKNEKWAEENIKSACSQKSTNPYRVIVINDCSPDNTGKIIDDYIAKNNLSSFVQVIHNKERVGAMANIYYAIHLLIPDNHVVVSLDGDDTLAHNEALLELEKRYQDPNIWITWGSVKKVPTGQEDMSRAVPDSVFREHKLREYPFVTQHLRTFRAGLFKKVKKEDMMHEGKFLSVTWDMAFMYPMLEMATAKVPQANHHHAFIKEILYLYRVDNPLNDFRARAELQARMDKIMRSKPPYLPIDKL